MLQREQNGLHNAASFNSAGQIAKSLVLRHRGCWLFNIHLLARLAPMFSIALRTGGTCLRLVFPQAGADLCR